MKITVTLQFLSIGVIIKTFFEIRNYVTQITYQEKAKVYRFAALQHKDVIICKVKFPFYAILLTRGGWHLIIDDDDGDDVDDYER